MALGFSSTSQDSGARRVSRSAVAALRAAEDVQEFLAFCLDALHEDLNRVRQRPAAVTPSQEKRDANLAARHAQVARARQLCELHPCGRAGQPLALPRVARTPLVCAFRHLSWSLPTLFRFPKEPRSDTLPLPAHALELDVSILLALASFHLNLRTHKGYIAPTRHARICSGGIVHGMAASIMLMSGHGGSKLSAGR